MKLFLSRFNFTVTGLDENCPFVKKKKNSQTELLILAQGLRFEVFSLRIEFIIRENGLRGEHSCHDAKLGVRSFSVCFLLFLFSFPFYYTFGPFFSSLITTASFFVSLFFIYAFFLFHYYTFLIPPDCLYFY